VKFASYWALDAYSTREKLMGRQQNGENFLHSVIALDKSAGFTRWAGFEPKPSQSLKQSLIDGGFQGRLQWHALMDRKSANSVDVLYYPAPLTSDLAHLRNRMGVYSYSLMGITHTLSSTAAMDQLSALSLSPFQDWDALICTSEAAKRFAQQLIDSTRHYWQEQAGATKFPKVHLPVIPLGVDTNRFKPDQASRLYSRTRLGFNDQTFVVLFVGRLSFHAKANPLVVYQTLERLAKVQSGQRVVYLEVGRYPNDSIRQAFADAQKTLAPSLECQWVNGENLQDVQEAWRVADVFVSCSDNVQETFGLTPLEAMASGLPVIVSDWDGYRDTVRDGVDGFCIPSVLPDSQTGAGQSLQLRQASQLESYDYYIGKLSLMTVIQPQALFEALLKLAREPAMRRFMGESGRQRALQIYDWKHILQQYDSLAQHLSDVRVRAKRHAIDPDLSIAWPQRPDPLDAFAHFATARLKADTRIARSENWRERWEQCARLQVATFALNHEFGTLETVAELLQLMTGSTTINHLLEAYPALEGPRLVRLVMLGLKFDLIYLVDPLILPKAS
jgi:glycosyltransferase involved in cell wall biosynthesis